LARENGGLKMFGINDLGFWPALGICVIGGGVLTSLLYLFLTKALHISVRIFNLISGIVFMGVTFCIYKMTGKFGWIVFGVIMLVLLVIQFIVSGIMAGRNKNNS
jgi:hypothetical protein